LNCARRDAGLVWYVREYFVVQGDVRFVVGCGSSAPDEDEELFATVAERFELLETA
jgi:hypothetical protein